MKLIKNFYFDVETYKYIDKDIIYNIPYLIGVCDEAQNYNVFYNVDDFIAYLFSQSENNCLINVWAFNASYDITSINPLINDIRLSRTGALSEKNELLKYKIKMKKGPFIQFYDLWRYDKNQSIRSWYDVLDPDSFKGSIEYDKYELSIEGNTLYYKDENGNPRTSDLQEELDYLKRDVIILPKIHQYINMFKTKISSFVKDHFNLPEYPKLDLLPTISSVSKKVVSEIFKNKYGYDFNYIFRQSLLDGDFKVNDLDTISVLNASKMGGFTSFNYDCLSFDNESYTYFDINSLYPHLMTKSLPIGSLWSSKERCLKAYYKTYPRLKHFVPEVQTVYKITYSKTEWKPEFQNIGKGPFKSRVPYQQLYIYKDLLEKYQLILDFKDLEILETYYIAHIPILKDIILELYSLKSNSPKDTIEYTASKLILNSIYGKTNEEEHLEQYKINNNSIELEVKSDVKFLSIFAGIWICSMGHMGMIDLIYNAKKQHLNWFYCDTDSFILPTNQNIITNIDNVELGAFKVEGIFHKGSNPGLSKKYILENDDEIKIATSGISTTIIEALPYDLKYKFFNGAYNLCFKQVKTTATTNHLSQKIIRNVDFESNNRIDINYNIYLQKYFDKNKLKWKVVEIETVNSKTH